MAGKKHQKVAAGLSKKTIVLLVVLGVLVIALCAGGAYALNWAKQIRNNPGSFFAEATPAPTAEPVLEAPTPAPVPEDGSTPLPLSTAAPTATLTPYEQLMADADRDMMKGIVNVLLIGVDYAPERETWSGKKDFHADVLLVLAINFNENTVDMISIPRDTYMDMPNVKGIYKINASYNVGGPEECCAAASWMLGGIPVDYYYLVTMPVVKDLVNAMGGVDYDMDVAFTMMGRKYQKGLQHMDGQAVLDYIRVRKNVEQSGDQNRINRQKKILVKIFETMQEKNLLVNLPAYYKAFVGQMETNTTLEQTAALGAFAYTLPSANINMLSMGGRTTDVFGWSFVCTDQKKRVEIIKQVYGLDVRQEKDYTRDAALLLWGKMRYPVYVKNAQNVLSKAVIKKVVCNTILSIIIN